MRDQQFQALENFQETYKQFHIAMKLTKQNSSLEINVQNKETLDRYYVQITMKYIQQEKEFVNIFVQPIEIMDYIIHHFKDVVVQDGVIRFQYLFGTIKKRVKAITIKMNKLQVDPLQRAQLKIKKLSQTLHQREERIKKDEQIKTTYQKEIQRLSQTVHENNLVKKDLKDQILKLNYILEEKEELRKQSQKAAQKFTSAMRQKLMKQELLVAQIERLNQALREMSKKEQALMSQIARLSHINNNRRR